MKLTWFHFKSKIFLYQHQTLRLLKYVLSSSFKKHIKPFFKVLQFKQTSFTKFNLVSVKKAYELHLAQFQATPFKMVGRYQQVLCSPNRICVLAKYIKCRIASALLYEVNFSKNDFTPHVSVAAVLESCHLTQITPTPTRTREQR